MLVRRTLLQLCAAALIFPASGALASAYPSRPVYPVVGFSPAIPTSPRASWRSGCRSSLGRASRSRPRCLPLPTKYTAKLIGSKPR
jgi:hypothetical protein